jgi:hypothetical protein
MTHSAKGLLVYAINNKSAYEIGETLRSKPLENVIAVKYEGLWLEDELEKLCDKLFHDDFGFNPPELRREITLYMKRKKEWINKKAKEVGADFSVELHSSDYSPDRGVIFLSLIYLPVNKKMGETLEKFRADYAIRRDTPRNVGIGINNQWGWNKTGWPPCVPYHHVFATIGAEPFTLSEREVAHQVIKDLLIYLTRNYKRKCAERGRNS